MQINEPNFEKIYSFEDRLVRFAGECIFFVRKLEKSYEIEYYKNQLIRSSGSSSLNYGEAQGTITSEILYLKFLFPLRNSKSPEIH